jgi:hypothetical protein
MSILLDHGNKLICRGASLHHDFHSDIQINHEPCNENYYMNHVFLLLINNANDNLYMSLLCLEEHYYLLIPTSTYYIASKEMKM